MTKKFKCSFAGEVDYSVDGELYRVRYFANPRMGYNVGVYDREIVAAVGTVRHDDSRKFGTFPPAAVVALFPGFVGARWNTAGDWSLEYDGPRPVVFTDPQVSDYMTCAAALLERAS